MKASIRYLEYFMVPRGDRVADCVLSKFYALPAKAKPRSYPNGSREWTPLCGIVFSIGDGERLDCVSLGTGMRCLPEPKVSFAKGRCLHDWHAEVVAMRALNLFLIQECAVLAKNENLVSTEYIRRRAASEIDAANFQPFAIKDNVRIHMYSSEAPCGDASMELTMNRQDDSTPWRAPLSNGNEELKGRGYFSQVGIVRRKPSRGDAPATLSKSCSDKLALKQCTSLLSSVSCLLIHPSTAYLDELVLPESQYVSSAIARAFQSDGRMHRLVDPQGTRKVWPGGFYFKPFHAIKTSRDFHFSRYSANSPMTGSNITACWTSNLQEVLIGGTIQGNKQFSKSGTSAISKLGIWKAAVDVLKLINSPSLLEAVQSPCYSRLKQSEALKSRRAVKEDVIALALHNWTRNNRGDTFLFSDQ